MPNSIALRDKFLAMLDQTYVQEGITRVLDAGQGDLNFTGVNTVKVQNISTTGFGNVTRGGTPHEGSVTVATVNYTLPYDRGTSFKVDPMDNEETSDIAFGRAGAEFMRSNAIPELDATRFANLVAKAGYTPVSADLTNLTVTAALDTAILAMNKASVPRMDRVFFCTWDVIDLLEKADGFTRNVDYTLPGNVGKVVTAYKGIPLIGVEPGRFYTQVTLLNTAAGGFGKTAATGRDLNFILVHVPSAKGGIIKYAPSDIIPAGNNANSWADTMKFRMYHGLVIMDNKKKGIYAHHKTT